MLPEDGIDRGESSNTLQGVSFHNPSSNFLSLEGLIESLGFGGLDGGFGGSWFSGLKTNWWMEEWKMGEEEEFDGFNWEKSREIRVCLKVGEERFNGGEREIEFELERENERDKVGFDLQKRVGVL